MARRLTRLLVERGDRVRGLIRNPDHADDLRADGAEPVVCDLEEARLFDVSELLEGVDAVVFAAGAGPGSGAARKQTMDYEGAVKVIGAPWKRFVMISSVGAEQPPEGDDAFSAYLRAKAEADRALIAAGAGRDWTIVRPGPLTDDPGTGRVRLSTEPFRGEVTRDDVAAVVAALLHEPRAAELTLYLAGGESPVEEALAEVLP